MKLQERAFALAAGSVAAIAMLALSILAALGLYVQAAELMSQWHMYYSVTVVGTITGIIEAFIISYIFSYLFAFIYNKAIK